MAWTAQSGGRAGTGRLLCRPSTWSSRLGEQWRKRRRPSMGRDWEEGGVPAAPRCVRFQCSENRTLQFARLVITAWCVGTSRCRPQAAKPVQSCCSLTDTSRHSLLGGENTSDLHWLRSQQSEIYGQAHGGRSETGSRPWFSVSTWGPPPSLTSQMTAKRTLRVWNLRPGHAFRDLLKGGPCRSLQLSRTLSKTYVSPS